MDNVYEFLKKLNILYTIYNHEAVFTIEESRQHRINTEFGENKNLFLRNKKGDKHYLVTLDASKRLDLDKFAISLNEKKVNFASEDRLKKYLHLTPGSVSPFGLINDIQKEVVFVLDNDLLKHDYLGFHPNINTQTVVLKTSDFKKFLESAGNQVLIMNL